MAVVNPHHGNFFATRNHVSNFFQLTNIKGNQGRLLLHPCFVNFINYLFQGFHIVDVLQLQKSFLAIRLTDF